MTAALFGSSLNLISDSMRCAGMPEGEYELAVSRLWMKEGKATLADGTLAGSSIHLMDGLRNAGIFWVPLEQAVMAATLLRQRPLEWSGRLVVSGQVHGQIF